MVGRPKEWQPIPSWDGYEAHPTRRIRRGTHVLKKFLMAGAEYVKLRKTLRTHMQTFSVPVDRVMDWTFADEPPCAVCGHAHDDHRHEIHLRGLRRLKVPLIHIRNTRNKVFG
jgi:hypothetical protein